jgi:thiol-disulfide isomerase/thioredoxin
MLAASVAMASMSVSAESTCGSNDPGTNTGEEIIVQNSVMEDTFYVYQGQIQLDNGKPVIRLFTTSWCPHCEWIKDTFDVVVREYVQRGEIIAHHWEMDTGDNILTPNIEKEIPQSEFDIFKRFSPQGSVPSFVFGEKYWRVGNGYESQNDLLSEKYEFKVIIEKLIQKVANSLDTEIVSENLQGLNGRENYDNMDIENSNQESESNGRGLTQEKRNTIASNGNEQELYSSIPTNEIGANDKETKNTLFFLIYIIALAIASASFILTRKLTNQKKDQRREWYTKNRIRKILSVTLCIFMVTAILAVTMETSKQSQAKLMAKVTIEPDTLNLQSKDKWITAYIELSSGYDPSDIIVPTVMMNDFVLAESNPTKIGDHDGNGVPDLMVKFAKTDFEDSLLLGINEIKISFELTSEEQVEEKTEILVFDTNIVDDPNDSSNKNTIDDGDKPAQISDALAYTRDDLEETLNPSVKDLSDDSDIVETEYSDTEESIPLEGDDPEVQNEETATFIPAPSSNILHESYGLCPGAPPSEGGMKRRPDSVKDGNGVLHKVWQERIDGQFEICYARKPGEMGLGSDSNPAFRITKSPHDSVAPQIAVDDVSGIAYVIWTEILPPDLNHGGKGGGWTPEAILQYTATATFVPGDPVWTTAQTLGESICSLQTFSVQDSTWEIELKKGKPDWASIFPHLTPKPCTLPDLMPKLGDSCSLWDLRCEGIFDTDGDSISDSNEVMGLFGYITHWWNADSDLDWIPDPVEIIEMWNPTQPIWYEVPKCFPEPFSSKDPVCRAIWDRGLCLFLDIDQDGISACDEDDDYPVTTEVAEMTHGGTAVYRFWPKVNGVHNLVLRTQQRTFQPGTAGCSNVNISIEVTVDGVLANTWTGTWFDTTPWVWSVATVAAVNVTGVDFTAVTAAMSVDIGVTVLFDPSDCGGSILGILRALAVDWIKLELDSDRSEVNYKDADDFINSPPSFLVNVETEDMIIQLDSVQRDLLLELDSMSGHDWIPGVLNEAINAFSDMNIILNYKISETDLPITETTGVAGAGDVRSLNFAFPVDSGDEASTYLANHRDMSLQIMGYIHVMNVHNIPGACGIAEQGDTSTGPEFSGVLIPDQNFLDGLCYGFPDPPSDLFSTRLGVFLHEVGHALNAAHDKSTGSIDPLCVIDVCGTLLGPPDDDDICNFYNVMGYSYCSARDRTDENFYGTGNYDRRGGSSAPMGRPRFSYESEAQFDFNSLLSVDVVTNIDALGLYV